jgi:hypothetical protein
MAAAKVIESTAAELDRGPLANPYTILAMIREGRTFEAIRPRITRLDGGAPLTWSCAINGALFAVPHDCSYRPELEQFEAWLKSYPRD